MLKNILAAALLTTLFLTSCSKSDIVQDPYMIVGTWQITDIRSDKPYDWDGDGFSETDIFGNYSYCQRDIVLVFEQDGYGQSRQGCNSYWQSMYWQLGNANRTLQISLPGDELNLDLIQFSQSTIRGEDQVYINGQYFIITYTLSRR